MLTRTLALAAAACVAAGCQSASIVTSPNTTTKAHTSRPAHPGDTLTLHGNGSGELVAVTLVAVKPTARSASPYDHPDRGKRYYAAQFRIRNAGSAAYDDSPSNGAKVIDSRGQQYDAAFATDVTAGPSLPSDLKLATGQSALGYITFQVPKTARIVRVQFAIDSGYGQAGQWSL